MTAATAMVYINLSLGLAGATVYLLWSGKWYRRRAWFPFWFNLLAALACVGFSAGYAAILVSPHPLEVIQGVFRYFVALLIGAPTLARIVEYRRDQRREQYAHEVMRSMRSEAQRIGEDRGVV